MPTGIGKGLVLIHCVMDRAMYEEIKRLRFRPANPNGTFMGFKHEVDCEHGRRAHAKAIVLWQRESRVRAACFLRFPHFPLAVGGVPCVLPVPASYWQLIKDWQADPTHSAELEAIRKREDLLKGYGIV